VTARGTAADPLRAVLELGQSIWLDDIRRDLITEGELARLVDGGLRGVTSNPAIFARAIAGSALYDARLAELVVAEPTAPVERLYEALAVEDIRGAADVLLPVWEATGGADGFVSLEVSPRLAHDAENTVAEAQRLWRLVDRPNLMIKVPATAEGLAAVEELLARGINVNVTLIFSLAHYEGAARAWLRGLGRCARPDRVASVASVFVSRLDTAVDRELETMGTPEALALRGHAAVANARRVYRRFRELAAGDEFRRLAGRGARPQRPLWASTSTKNPAYSDVKYVEELIGPDTVNTLPRGTLEAFRDHGRVEETLTRGWEEADAAWAALAGLGIDLDAVTDELQAAGVAAFAASFDELLGAIEARRQELRGTRR